MQNSVSLSREPSCAPAGSHSPPARHAPPADALLGSRNLFYCEIMPTRGANVLSILKRETLGITESGLNGLAERLGVDLVEQEGGAA